MDFAKNHSNKFLYFILIIYMSIGLFVINYYRYQIDPDGISYISIAQKYMNGNYKDAINGYWGPILSWLIVPFLFVKCDPQLAIRVILLFTGAICIIGIYLLIRRINIKYYLCQYILITCVPVIIYFSVYGISPDLIITTLIIFYIYYLFDPEYQYNTKISIILGIIGATMYLTKGYGFPFFVTSFIAAAIIRYSYIDSYRIKHKFSIIYNTSIGLIVFIVIVLIWASIISGKYGYYTVGTTGRYNHALIGPESIGHPMLLDGLIAPPNSTAISIWEDPSYMNIQNWSITRSTYNIKYQIMLILKNIYKMLLIYETSFSIFFVPIIIASIYILHKYKKNIVYSYNIAIMIMMFILYFFGYTIILVSARYLWVNYLFGILLCGIITSFMSDRYDNKQVSYRIFCIMLFASFTIMPIRYIVQNWNKDIDLHNMRNIIRNVCNVDGNIASNTEWHKTLYLSYYLGEAYYGKTKFMTNDKELLRELENNNIRYYFQWKEDGNGNGNILKIGKEITHDKIKGLKIYHVE